MLNKLKNFINQKTNEIQSAPVVVQETQEKKIVNSFNTFVQDMKVHDGFPKKGIQFLEDILKVLYEMDTQTISLQEQANIRKIVEKEIPHMVELYFSVPKAHAVSFILENGKTSKDTLIDKLSKLSKQISDIWDNAVIEKTNLLVKKQKEISKPKVAKKDFFDM